MKFGAIVYILLVVQPVSHILATCCGSCRNNEEFVDVEVDVYSFNKIQVDNFTHGVVLKKPDSNDPTAVLCNVFHGDIACNFCYIDNKGGICGEINDLVLFKEEKEDLDGKKKTSYLAFNMENFRRLGENMHSNMKMVEFDKIKLFIEDENKQSVFILNADCYDTFKYLLIDNKNKLFKRTKDNGGRPYFASCGDFRANHEHKDVEGLTDMNKITLKIPKSLLEKK